MSLAAFSASAFGNGEQQRERIPLGCDKWANIMNTLKPK
jgi:hypothetical protein